MKTCAIGCAIMVAAVLVACDEVSVTAEWNALPGLLQDESPAGIYVGNITDTSGGDPIAQPVTAIVDVDGDIQIIFPIDAERHVAGRVEVYGNSLAGVLAEYSGRIAGFTGAGSVNEMTISGSVSAGTAITGEYAADTHAGRFALDYQAIHDIPSSLALTSGVWSFSTASSGGVIYTTVWEIDESGAVFATDNLGCVFVGNVRVNDPFVNAYAVSLQVTSCGYFNGDYSGLAFLGSSGFQGTNALKLSMANDIFAYVAALQQ